MVEHLPQNQEVEGLSPATVACTLREKMVQTNLIRSKTSFKLIEMLNPVNSLVVARNQRLILLSKNECVFLIFSDTYIKILKF